MKSSVLTFFALLLVGTWSVVYAQDGEVLPTEPLVLTDREDEYPLGRYLDLLEDPEGGLTIEDIASPAYADKFRPSQVEVPNLGFTDSIYWVRLHLRNESQSTDQWILELANANMHYVDLFSPLPDGNGFEVAQSGALRPPANRDLLYPQPIFGLTIPNQGDQTFYMRFENGASMTLPLVLWEPTTFFANSFPKLIWQGLFLGVMVGLIGYNLFLFVSLRDGSYLYLVLLLVGIVGYDVSRSGLFSVYVFPRWFFLDEQAVSSSVALIFISLILFNDAFVSANRILPRIHLANLASVAIWAVLGVSILVLSFHDLALVMSTMIIATLVVVTMNDVLAWRKGFRATRFLLVAWAGLLIGLLLYILTRMGIAPSNFFSENSYRLGFAWMAVCWSIALADRINLLKGETEVANRELQLAEQRLRQTLEAMPVGVVVYGPDQKPIYINNRTADILTNPERGIGPHPNLERTLPEAMKYYAFRVRGTDEAYPLEEFPVYRALQGEAAHADDIEADLVDRRVPIEAWASPVFDATGDIESAVVAFQDITQRKRAEEAQRTSEKRFRAIVENVFDGIAFLDRDRNILYVSPSYEQLNGVRGAEMIGKSGALTVHPDDQTYVAAAFQTLLQQPGRRVSAEYRIRHQDGSWIWVETRVMNLLDDPHVQAVVLSSRDISERKQAEMALDQYRQHLEELVDIRTAQLRNMNEWLSMHKEIRQTVGSTSDLQQAYTNLLDSILHLFDARLVFLLLWNDRTKLFDVEGFQQRENDPVRIPNSLALNIGNSSLFRQKLLRGEALALSVDHAATVPAVVRESFFEYEYKSLILNPVTSGHATLAILGLLLQKDLGEIAPEMDDLIRTISLDMANLIEGARLLDQAQAIVAAQERNSLARELHDSVTQILFSASVLAESTPRIWEKDQEIARMNMEKLSLLLRGALAEMRALLFELRSDKQQDQSLEKLLTGLVDSLQAQTQIPVTVLVDNDPEPPGEVRQVFYRIARESLNNVIKHAQATHVSVILRSEPNYAELHIEDDGRGFDAQNIDGGHLGISIMNERAVAIKSRLQIVSTPGKGTEVVVTWHGNGAGKSGNG